MCKMESVKLISDIADGMFYYVHNIHVYTYIIGAVGNAVACVVILCSKYFHTLTGFYLLSLSISDLLILHTGIFYSIYLGQFEFLSHIKLAHYVGEWIFQTSVIVSTLTVTAFTVERYLAICHPFFVISLPKKSRVRKIIVTIWSISSLLALVPVTQIYIERQLLSAVNEKNLVQASEDIFPYITDIWAALCFFMPMSVITVLYLLIWIKLKNTSEPTPVVSRADRADMRTMIMFVIIVAIFFVSWAPYHIYRLMVANMYFARKRFVKYDLYWIRLIQEFRVINEVQQMTYPLSSVINPMIYLMLSKNFRAALKDGLLRAPRYLASLLIHSRSTSNSTKTAS